MHGEPPASHATMLILPQGRTRVVAAPLAAALAGPILAIAALGALDDARSHASPGDDRSAASHVVEVVGTGANVGTGEALAERTTTHPDTRWWREGERAARLDAQRNMIARLEALAVGATPEERAELARHLDIVDTKYFTNGEVEVTAQLRVATVGAGVDARSR